MLYVFMYTYRKVNALCVYVYLEKSECFMCLCIPTEKRTLYAFMYTYRCVDYLGPSSFRV
jgi:hypothetical protein